MDTWIAPPANRVPEPRTGPERAMLQGWLDWHRQTLLTKCAGLTAEQLRTASAPPSDLTLLGLVRHMSQVERSWFRFRAAGDRTALMIYTLNDNENSDFDDVATADPAADLATFTDECAAADAAVASLALDHEFSTARGTISVRWVYLHMIEEYARHNGHADLLRERVDGATGA
ncbi:DinB family protein [Actinoplanes sp. LDG1-06]|uniref:DinB family protein n=1 Tax=Paractinoplanes ovalisporus TaxID=2810368 RepID=A0ABS2ACQ2_9ACTN|nr:DinB family protein [Actinoplanes ovalisporus]MBM2617570.1 DinB family protein [Actinoplanes ovalisporus]